MTRRRTETARSRVGPSAHLLTEDYWTLSQRPLHSLVFLTPLVLLYEIGALLYLTDAHAGMQETIRAKKLLDLFFNTFGVAGLLVSGVAMLVVLFIMHVLSKDRWALRPWVIVGMLLEATMWALPLMVFGAVFQRASAMIDPAGALGHLLDAGGLPAALANGPGGASGVAGGGGLLDKSIPARATIAIGAGIYEELLFRLIGVALLHLVAKDILRSREGVARVVAVVGTAAAFAVYHDVAGAGGSIDWGALVFFFAAGVYFGTIYVARGLGIVVAAHAAYDLIALVILPSLHRV
ncbi:MAG: type II CAAX prenyl endopeptidase Rce1 family protein [Phycisphaerales bacterium]